MNIRDFNETGILRFKLFLARCRSNPSFSELNEDLRREIQSLLFDEELSNEINFEINLSNKFNNRFEFGQFLYSIFGDNPLEKQTGVLSWLALLFIDKICEVNKKSGRLKVLSDYRYIPEVHNSFRFYRHLILTPLLAYQRLKENSIMVLSNPLYESSDAVEAVLSRQDYWANENLINLSRALYFDEKNVKPKTNAFAGRDFPGNATRLSRDIAPQLSMAYDLYECTPERIKELLPEEFDEWMNG